MPFLLLAIAAALIDAVAAFALVALFHGALILTALTIAITAHGLVMIFYFLPLIDAIFAKKTLEPPPRRRDVRHRRHEVQGHRFPVPAST